MIIKSSPVFRCSFSVSVKDTLPLTSSLSAREALHSFSLSSFTMTVPLPLSPVFGIISVVISPQVQVPVILPSSSAVAALVITHVHVWVWVGSLSIVLSIGTLSETLPFVMDTFPLILPAASVVASVLLRSPTVTVTSLIPAFVNAVSIFSCISCFVVPFVAV